MSKKIKNYHYKNSSGSVIESTDYASILSIAEPDMFSKVSQNGFIMYRGFNVDIDAFGKFVKEGSGRVTYDPMREFFNDSVQKVDAGTDEIGMHVEHGNNPFQPDMCWFYCKVSASKGSQTTICDGYRLWEVMPDNLKEKFMKKKIKYCRYIEGDKWKTLTKSLTPDITNLDDVTLDDFKRLIDCSGFQVELLENDTIYYEYTVSAVRVEENTGRQSFCNSILGPSYNYQAPIIKFEDDEEISDNILIQLKTLFDEVTIDIDWQSGDVVVIDNLHVMHGRREILDTNRTLFNAMSFR